ncbi:MAG TPA: replication initiator protein A [Clostridiaceae bacterium]|nr:replication initiator protein A [Clostridiaceae bacterium]
MKPAFNYYYGQEADQFTFYRIPKVLFTSDAFHGLSSDAKVLYGLFLDRMGLSLKNEWLDEQDRVFIYFTLEDIQKHMNCGHNKGVKMMAELDSEKGIGLIERVKQGLGKPTRIYVKNFTLQEQPAEEGSPEGQTANRELSTTLSTWEVKTSEKGKSALPINGSLDFRKEEANKTNLNKTEFNEGNISINPSYLSDPTSSFRHQEEIDRWTAYRRMIKENTQFDCLYQRYGDTATEILDIMVETVSSKRESIRINGNDFPASVVRSQLLKLNYGHIEYAIESLKNNTSKVYNIKAYVLATLYNTRLTVNHYYQAEINHGLYGS